MAAWSAQERRARLAASVTTFGAPAIATVVAVLAWITSHHPIAWAEDVIQHPGRPSVVAGLVLFSAIPTLAGLARAISHIPLERRYVIALENFVRQCPPPSQGAAQKPLGGPLGKIEFRDVTYRYTAATGDELAEIHAHFRGMLTKLSRSQDPTAAGRPRSPSCSWASFLPRLANCRSRKRTGPRKRGPTPSQHLASRTCRSIRSGSHSDRW